MLLHLNGSDSNRIVSFVASLVPLVIKISLNRVLVHQCGKTFISNTLVMLFKAQFVPAQGMYIFVVVISILDFASPVSFAMIPDMP